MSESAPAPSADDRSRYETLKKELMQALPKKRINDKQLVVRIFTQSFSQAKISFNRPRSNFKFTTLKRPILQRQQRTAEETLFKVLKII